MPVGVSEDRGLRRIIDPFAYLLHAQPAAGKGPHLVADVTEGGDKPVEIDAVGLGLAMGYFRPLYNLFEPLVEVLRPIPGPAYLPVLVLFVGIGHEMKVVLVMVASFFPILLNTYSGVRSIDRVQFDTARTLGLTTLQTFRELVLPAASPQILTGMRISLAISLILAILGEMIVSTDGLGYYTLLAQRTFKIPDMYAGIFMMALFGYVLNRLFLLFESRLIRWHIESTGR